VGEVAPAAEVVARLIREYEEAQVELAAKTALVQRVAEAAE
jgi:hypothetical protein